LARLTANKHLRDEEGYNMWIFIEQIFRLTQTCSLSISPWLLTDFCNQFSYFEKQRIQKQRKGSFTSAPAIYATVNNLAYRISATIFCLFGSKQFLVMSFGCNYFRFPQIKNIRKHNYYAHLKEKILN
jgi:F0F1-type ATP synthase beta subunit